MMKNNKNIQNTPNIESSGDSAEFEIGDVENYRSDKLQVFNHQTLVMTILMKASDAGSHELREGWFNEKIDDRGNVIRTYIEDTRAKFIECVRTAVNVLACDFDNEAKEKIEKIISSLKKIKGDLKKDQWKWFENLSPKLRTYYYERVHQDFLSVGLQWYLVYKEAEIAHHRMILEELHNLTKRLDFYESQDFEA